MADKEKYLIKIQGKLIEVSEDVYYAYFRMERQERWQEEKKQEHEVVSYDAMDTEEACGESVIAADLCSCRYSCRQSFKPLHPICIQYASIFCRNFSCSSGVN